VCDSLRNCSQCRGDDRKSAADCVKVGTVVLRDFPVWRHLFERLIEDFLPLVDAGDEVRQPCSNVGLGHTADQCQLGLQANRCLVVIADDQRRGRTVLCVSVPGVGPFDRTDLAVVD
jgi:hypothetical protein